MYHIKSFFIKIIYVSLLMTSINQQVFSGIQEDFLVAIKKLDMPEVKRLTLQLDIDVLEELLLRPDVDVNAYVTIKGGDANVTIILWQEVFYALSDHKMCGVDDKKKLLEKLISNKKIDLNADIFVEYEEIGLNSVSSRCSFSFLCFVIRSDLQWLFKFFITHPDVDINKDFLYKYIINNKSYTVTLNCLSVCCVLQNKEYIFYDLLAHPLMDYETILKAYNFCRQLQFHPYLLDYFFCFSRGKICIELYVSILQEALMKRRNDFLSRLQSEA